MNLENENTRSDHDYSDRLNNSYNMTKNNSASYFKDKHKRSSSLTKSQMMNYQRS